MRYGIFSDIHSNLEALDAVIEAFEKERIDRYLCVGDLVGYAANPNECVKKVRSLSTDIVAGNHDQAAVGIFPADNFNPTAKEAINWTRQNLNEESVLLLKSLGLTYKNRDLVLAHGTLDNPGDFNYMLDDNAARKSFALLENNICFIGHTHVSGIFIKDPSSRITYLKQASLRINPQEKYIINVGSVGQPRDNNPQAAYCIYDTEAQEIEIKRTPYDIQGARKKILDAGLPRFLGDRLLEGV